MPYLTASKSHFLQLKSVNYQKKKIFAPKEEKHALGDFIVIVNLISWRIEENAMF